jgi:hypothetical protein
MKALQIAWKKVRELVREVALTMAAPDDIEANTIQSGSNWRVLAGFWLKKAGASRVWNDAFDGTHTVLPDASVVHDAICAIAAAPAA